MDQVDKQLLLYILTPIIAAFIGWITNLIAVKMLFHPQKPLNFFGFKIQGLVPKRQKELAQKISQTVEKNLISVRDFASVVKSKEVEEQLLKVLEGEIDIFIGSKLSGIPMVGMFISGEVGNIAKKLLVDQLQSSIPRLIDGVLNSVESKLDINKIISERVMEFELNTLEDIIYEISGRELIAIEILGGILGFVVGLGQVGLMIMTQ